MSEENKALMRRFVEEVWNKGNVAAADQFLAANVVDRTPMPGMPPGIEGAKRTFTMMRSAFPDLRVTVEDMIAEGDKVVGRFTMRGTHRGEFMGIAPTGKQATVAGIEINRIAGGKVVEHWDQWDALGLMQQLGAMPPPGR